MNLAQVMGWGRDSECSKEVITHTLPGGTMVKVDVKRVVSQNLAMLGYWPHSRQHKRERFALLSWPTCNPLWYLVAQCKVGVLGCLSFLLLYALGWPSIYTCIYMYGHMKLYTYLWFSAGISWVRGTQNSEAALFFFCFFKLCMGVKYACTARPVFFFFF